MNTSDPPSRFVPIGNRIGRIGHHYQGWLVHRNRSDAQDPGNALLRVTDVADQAVLDGKLSAEQLEFIVVATDTKSKNSFIASNLGDIIERMEARGVDVVNLLWRLIDCKSIDARFTAVHYVYGHKDKPLRDFEYKLLARGLADKAKLVRRISAEALFFGHRTGQLQELRSDLESALAKEKDPWISHVLCGVLGIDCQHAPMSCCSGRK